MTGAEPFLWGGREEGQREASEACEREGRESS